MFGRLISLAALTVLITVAGCGSKDEASEETQGEVAVEEVAEPEQVTVQHILIGFQGTLPGKNVTRSREEAEQLAADLLESARAGADFDSLVQMYTDDSHPGIYKMANLGVPANPAEGVYPRGGMVKGFGDVGFSLGVGEIGMAAYDPETSKYGWHIIKRID